MAIVVIVLAVLLTACGSHPTSPTPASPAPPPTAVSSTVTRLSFTSDPASFVGHGEARTYTLQNATFGPQVGQVGGYVSVVVRPTEPSDTSNGWSVVMMAPFGRVLTAGTFSTLQAPTSTAHMFDFSGGGRSCGSGTSGSLTIHEIVATTDTIQRLRASFVLYCGGSPTVRGDIVVLADPWR